MPAKLDPKFNFIRTSPQRKFNDLNAVLEYLAHHHDADCDECFELNAVLEYLAHHHDADCKAIGKFAKSKPTDIRDL